MTVSSTLNRKTYAGNGVTVSFATSPLIFFSDDDLVVNVTNDDTQETALLVLDTDYTVTGGNGEVGTVDLTLYGAPATGYTVVIKRALEVVQEYDPENNDINDAEALEQALDKLTMMVQQLSNRFAFVIQRSEADVTNVSYILPPGYGDVLGRDESGNIVSVDPADLPNTQPLTIRNVTATTYTIVAGDNQNIVNMVNGGTVTAPTGLTTGFMVGITSGSGVVAIEDDGNCEVRVAASFFPSLSETDSFATLTLTATDSWLLYGDLLPA